jgi:ABC-type branched-subunit amino acid transport system ATPase component
VRVQGERFRWWRPAAGLEAAADALLDQVGLATQADRATGVLACGDLKRLELAIALAAAPRPLLMDEPSEGLSPLIVEQMVDAILALQAEGLSILMAEQNLHFATRVVGEAVVLESGRVVWAGSLAALEADAEAYRRYE